MGTRWADLDPLKRLPRRRSMNSNRLLRFLRCRPEQDLQRRLAQRLARNCQAWRYLETLKQTYCGTVGVEYMYMTDYNEKRWLQERLESHSFAAEPTQPSRKSAFLSG
jgi:2-oxoglutarate dehydrogenase E1 component